MTESPVAVLRREYDQIARQLQVSAETVRRCLAVE